MAVASMTGFARETGVTGAAQWAWELKSVNGRGLDVRLRVPPGYDALGEEARAAVQKAVRRGQCQLSLVVGRAAGAPRLRLNVDLLRQLVEDVQAFDWPHGIAPPTGDGLIAVRGVIDLADEDEAGADPLVAEGVRAGIARLVQNFVAARLREGEALARIVAGQLDRMEALTRDAEACPARRPEAVRERLRAQLALLVEAPAALDPARLHQEAVLIAAKADIREELDRLAAHLSAARALLAQGGAIGRQLDFLAQELGREANTLCAKANDIALSRIGLDLKAVIEQFREQVQNVE